jgi:predicted site-specific integrase-resolvase
MSGKVHTTKEAKTLLKISRQTFYAYAIRLKITPTKEADVVKNVIRSIWKDEDVKAIGEEIKRRRAAMNQPPKAV